MNRSLVPSLLLLAGCGLELGGTGQLGDPARQDADLGYTYEECVIAVLGLCDDLDLANEECTGWIGRNCNAVGDDPNEWPDDGDGEDGACWDEVLSECLNAGGDEAACNARADEVCNGIYPDGTYPEGTDPNGMTCWDEVFRECQAAGGTDEECSARAEAACENTEGEGTVGCWDEVFQECLSCNLTEEECVARADEACNG